MNKTNKPSYNGRTKPSIKTAAPLMNEAKQTIDSLVAEKKQMIKFLKKIQKELRASSVYFDSQIEEVISLINEKLKIYK